ncbi:MAG: hypothetical protein DHS20C11_20360 [Lysobacteraceae bacterium]|nr:MAG: hypothetical protein DHS20C11_20360 [Xanthomonadaceae bacterium]
MLASPVLVLPSHAQPHARNVDPVVGAMAVKLNVTTVPVSVRSVPGEQALTLNVTNGLTCQLVPVLEQTRSAVHVRMPVISVHVTDARTQSALACEGTSSNAVMASKSKARKQIDRWHLVIWSPASDFIVNTQRKYSIT